MNLSKLQSEAVKELDYKSTLEKAGFPLYDKHKELDYSELMKKSVSRTVKLTNILNSLKTIEDLDKLLTQQRTELLEEIMKIIEVNVHVGSGYTDECDKNQLIEEIKKL